MSNWLSPAAVAKACGGRVVRAGRPARRVMTDSRTAQPGDCFLALRGPTHDGHAFLAQALMRGASGVVVDRPIDALALPDDAWVVIVRDTSAALLRLAAEHRARHAARVVGITGSCGKTSTKDMLGRVMSAAMPTVFSPQSFNNNVGVPLTLFQIQADTRCAVVEIGTNAPGEVEALSRVARPDIGIVTCVSEAHLHGLGSLSGVAREKAGLLAGMADDGVAILNGDDASCRAMAERCSQRVVLVRVDGEADWFATEVQFHGIGTTFRIRGERPVTLPRAGTHNVYNALLCVAAASELGVPLDTILDELGRLPPTSRRLEYKRCGDVTVFDDTYNMNPASARAALAALAGLTSAGRKFVVFGEMLELGERSAELHRALGDQIAHAGVDFLVTVGDGALPIGAGARDGGLDASRLVHANDPTHALDLLMERLRPQDLVLCKASRRVGLDRLVDGLSRELARGEVAR